MSFSSDTKDALAREPLLQPCCQRAELSAFLHLAGQINLLGGGKRAFSVTTESQVVARRVYQLIKRLYGYNAEVAMKENKRLNHKHTFFISVPDAKKADQILFDTSVLKESDGYATVYQNFEPALMEKICCRQALARAAFLACGSLSNPEKSYHLELIVRSRAYADSLLDILSEMGVTAKTTLRKGVTVVYVKGADQISVFLANIGAVDAMLAFENIRVLKDVRNNVNRAVNCENANVDKTVRAAERKMQNIRYILRYRPLEKWPEALRQAAELRLASPYAPLSELCDMTEGELGKSGLNHRFRKIEALADQIRAEKGEIND